MKRLITFTLISLSLAVVACRSDADRMAQFCLDLDRAVESAQGNCAQMAQNIRSQIDGHSETLSRLDVCKKTTACRPCRKAVTQMLARCGYDDEFSPIVQRFHFSDSLRQSFGHADERQD